MAEQNPYSLFGVNPAQIQQRRAEEDAAISQRVMQGNQSQQSGLLGLATQSGRMGGRALNQVFGTSDPELERATKLQAASRRVQELASDPSDPSTTMPIMIQALNEQGLTAEAFQMAERFRNLRREDKTDLRNEDQARRQQERHDSDQFDRFVKVGRDSETDQRLANQEQRAQEAHDATRKPLEEQIAVAKELGHEHRAKGLQRVLDQSNEKFAQEKSKAQAEIGYRNALAAAANNKRALGDKAQNYKAVRTPDGGALVTYMEKGEDGKYELVVKKYDSDGNLVEVPKGTDPNALKDGSVVQVKKAGDATGQANVRDDRNWAQRMLGIGNIGGQTGGF